jgi:hypothetical protein
MFFSILPLSKKYERNHTMKGDEIYKGYKIKNRPDDYCRRFKPPQITNVPPESCRQFLKLKFSDKNIDEFSNIPCH